MNSIKTDLTPSQGTTQYPQSYPVESTPLTFPARSSPALQRCIWIYGLPSSGKTTLATAIVEWINAHTGRTAMLLDGDRVRKVWHGNPLGYSVADRDLNIGNICRLATLVSEQGIIPVVAAITPYAHQRQYIRATLYSSFLVEIDHDAEWCEKNDRKGLWKKARAGEVENFTGVSDPFDKGAVSDYDFKTPVGYIAEKLAVKIIINAIPRI